MKSFPSNTSIPTSASSFSTMNDHQYFLHQHQGRRIGARDVSLTCLDPQVPFFSSLFLTLLIATLIKTMHKEWRWEFQSSTTTLRVQPLPKWGQWRERPQPLLPPPKQRRPQEPRFYMFSTNGYLQVYYKWPPWRWGGGGKEDSGRRTRRGQRLETQIRMRLEPQVCFFSTFFCSTKNHLQLDNVSGTRTGQQGWGTRGAWVTDASWAPGYFLFSFFWLY